MKSSLLQSAQKLLVLDSLHCEGIKNDWLKNIARYSIQDLNYTNLQLSYIDVEGNNSFCMAGWEDLPYFSDRVNDDTIFSYASVTKIFTSELVLNLIRSQQISLDDKLIKFLPKLDDRRLKDARVKNISISDLLSHRSGFDSNLTPDTMVSPSPWCPYEPEVLQHIILDFEPNIKNVYSNLGYCLLALVIENVYKKSYIEVSQNYYNFNNSSIYFIENNEVDNQKIPDVNDNKYISNLDFFALSSVGGLAGTSKELSQSVYSMDKKTYPNITTTLDNIICKVESVRSCHGLSSYQYTLDRSLTIYWRDGRLPKTSALLTIDSKGGVIAFLSSTEKEDSWLSNHEQLVKKIYNSLLEM